MKRQMELFLIILLPILGLVFLGGKIMPLTKRPEQKITTPSSKKVVQKPEGDIRINNIEESGWGVDIPINDDNTLNLDEMYVGSDIHIGGRLLE